MGLHNPTFYKCVGLNYTYEATERRRTPSIFTAKHARTAVYGRVAGSRNGPPDEQRPTDQPTTQPTMTLKDIADTIGTITHEQISDNHNREQTTDLPRRNLNEYDGGYDPEGLSDRDKSYEQRCEELNDGSR